MLIGSKGEQPLCAETCTGCRFKSMQNKLGKGEAKTEEVAQTAVSLDW